MGQTLFVILGVMRSGTSAISRATRVFGADHGTHLLDPHDINPRGFWEDAEVLAIDEGLVEASHGKWERVGFVLNGEAENLATLQDRARLFLNEVAGHTERFAIKEPRMARLLDFWQPLFEESGWDCRYIIAFRNPISVAKSLHRFSQIDPVQAALLWTEYLMRALRQTAGETRTLLDYDRLIADPEATLRAAGDILGVDPGDPSEMQNYCQTFLTAELRHTTHNLSEVFASPEIPAMVATFYSRLLRCANGEIKLDDPEITASIEALEQLWRELTPIWQWIERLQGEAGRLTSEIASRDASNIEIAAQSAAREDHIDELTQRLAARDADLATEIAQRAILAEQLAAQADLLLHQSARLAAQETELERRQQLITAADRLIATLLSSKSWKLTRPLRNIRALLFKLFYQTPLNKKPLF